ncbi:MAG: hypothetical protein ACLGG0_13065 [Bacteriovoracia bacterium]
MKSSYGKLKIHKQELFEQIRGQAELHLLHNVHDCRTRRNEGNRWLFKQGMDQGIKSGIEYVLGNLQQINEDKRPMGQILLAYQFDVLETCRLLPFQAVEKWGLTELEDKLDIEREDIISGVQHGLYTTAHTLPRLLRNTKGPHTKAPYNFKFSRD